MTVKKNRCEFDSWDLYNAYIKELIEGSSEVEVEKVAKKEVAKKIVDK